MIGKYKSYKNRRTKECPRCGTKFEKNDIKVPLLPLKHVLGKDDRNFYGGNVIRFSDTTCTNCGMNVLLYLRMRNVEYVIHDVACTDTEMNMALDTPHLEGNNESVVQSDSQSVKVPLKGDSERTAGQDEATSISVAELEDRSSKLLVEAVKNKNLAVALKAVNDINQFFNIPKALEAAGIPKIRLLNESGKTMKKAEYIQLIKDFIKED